jgi:hypothetical protein
MRDSAGSQKYTPFIYLAKTTIMKYRVMTCRKMRERNFIHGVLRMKSMLENEKRVAT